MRVVIELRRDANPHIILNKLYKHTQLQQNFGINMLALVNNRPTVLTLRDMLYHYLVHQQEIITRRTRHDLKKAEERLHILAGFIIALDNLDLAIALIRNARDAEEARNSLMAKLPLSREQAQAILDLRLHRLTGLEREKIQQEFADLTLRAQELKGILADPKKIDAIIKEELEEISRQHGDKRRTKLVNKDGDLEIEDLIADEDVVITITHQGYIKRIPANTYRSQNRGGRGVAALNKREDDFVTHLFITSTHKNILFFTNYGQMYRKKVYEIPEASRNARGTALVNIIPLHPGEKISTVIQVKDFSPDTYLVMATKAGYVKKTSLDQFDTNLRSGLIATKLEDRDELIGVRFTNGEQEIMLFTKKGIAIRFSEKELRPMGRIARGVRGIRLGKEDELVEMVALGRDGHILLITQAGYGKRVETDEFNAQARGGKGVKAIGITEKSGLLVAGKMVAPNDDLMIVTANGVLNRQKVDGISVLRRPARGVKLIKLDPGDEVVAVASIVPEDEESQS
jgi:DNA gyrase subunit A